jgi:hypothetical protein
MRNRWGCILLGSAALVGAIALPAAHAESGADALLGNVVTQPAGAAPSKAADAKPQVTLGGIQLNDPFAMQLFTAWQSHGKLPYDVNAWVLRILRGETRQAAHQWSAIQSQVPGDFENEAKAAWLYVLWKVDLPQSFLDQWIETASSGDFLQSRLGVALDQVISPGFDAWLADHAITIAPEQVGFVRKLANAPGMVNLTLAAWVSLRDGDAAAQILPKLPITHRLKIPLARVAALGAARKGDLGGAGRILKTELEPAIEALHDPMELANHDLQIARLLYQAGAMDAAAEYYAKIPNQAPEYFKAREELTWVLLRQGDVSRLRGQLVTLSSPLFDGKFAPEVPLVRAISNLKLCYYDKVQKDFADFIRINTDWAHKIDAALKAENPPAPELEDPFSREAEKALAAREAEGKRLAALATESIQAVLPAVGPQSHWVKLQARMTALTEQARKQRSQEYRRQWSNRQAVLAEAIRKMQFVKVELMSELRSLARAPGSMDGSSLASAQDAIHLSQAAPVRAQPGQIVFPFDGVLWPDEMFHLRSVAQNRCLEALGGHSR